MKQKLFSLLIISMVIGLFACKKDYTIGGTITDPHVNMTTYDYLKTNSLFDTLLIVIDKTGLKDEVNSAGTFFAFTDYSILNFVKLKQEDRRVEVGDENLVYNFDSVDWTALRDSVRAYIFKDQITRNNTTETGRLFKANDGELRLIRLIPSSDYTNGTVFSTPPKYMYYTKMIPYENFPVPTDSTGIPNLDPHQLLTAQCQTTGIISTTGVIHVLKNQHIFAFHGDNN
jgi:hypothetical protein